jgi:hypothetical protein
MPNEREKLLSKFASRMIVDESLARSKVSFQSSKGAPFQWFKYKEAFSENLVESVLGETKGRILDPFAGIGTTLFAAARKGWDAWGIELMPVGIAVMQARQSAYEVDLAVFDKVLSEFWAFSLDKPGKYRFPHLKITEKAFPQETEDEISAYMDFVDGIESTDVKKLFWFACMAVLEEVSYTSKDGQYLRWDRRCGRKMRAKYEKRYMEPFHAAIRLKLSDMRMDIAGRGDPFPGQVNIEWGSCLSLLPRFGDGFDLIMTSPPYANRYDYTRSYALELAFSGCSDDDVKNMRQNMLTSTVENRSKRQRLLDDFMYARASNRFIKAEVDFLQHPATCEIRGVLMKAAMDGRLNNEYVVGMVMGYLYEMNLMISETAQLLFPGGRFVMVNDNVQYGGEEVPIDLLLSDFAEKAGLEVERIAVLPRGKGNSSQQMGKFGRKEMRKCVYHWRKP